MATNRKSKKSAAKETPAKRQAVKKAAAVSEAAPVKRARVERDLPVGTVLKRAFKGKEIEVRVTEAGFVFEDQVFNSISAVARRITGYQISGPVFFQLDTSSKAHESVESGA